MPIPHVDDRGQRSSAELIGTLEEWRRIMNAGGVPVLLLNDFSEATVRCESMARLKQVGRQDRALISRSALLGIHGPKQRRPKPPQRASSDAGPRLPAVPAGEVERPGGRVAA
jgi:hypothetical protein